MFATDSDGDTGTGDSGAFTIQPADNDNLPSGWLQSDIGSVSAAGHATYDSGSGEWTVTGDGADIWGTSDAFYYVARPLSGDGTITARVLSIQNVNAWSKAGVMIRESLSPGSKQVDAIVSPAKGIAMQYRVYIGLAVTSHDASAIAKGVFDDVFVNP